MGIGNVDYSLFFGDEDDAELEAEIRPDSKQKPRSAADAAAAARMVEGAIAGNGDGSSADTGDDREAPDDHGRLAGVSPSTTASTDGAGAHVDSSNRTGSILTGFYDTDDERAEAADLMAKTGSEPLPGGRRAIVNDETVRKEIQAEEDSPDLVGDMLGHSDSASSATESGNDRKREPTDAGDAVDPDEDIVLDEETIEEPEPPKSRTSIVSERDQSATRSHSGTALGRAHESKTARPVDDDDEEKIEVDSDAIARLEEKALDAVAREEAEKTEEAVEEPALPLPAPSPAPSVDGDGDDGEIGLNEAKNRQKYVIKSTADYMLVAPGDTGSEPFDIDDVLTDAIDRGASDVHIASMRPIKLRINGTMYKFAKYQVMDPADMNDLIANNGRLINKEMTQKFNTQRSVDTAYVIRRGRRHGERFRVHFAEEMNGPAIVFRHIRPEIFTPEEIGLTQDVVDWGLLSQGMILVTGPTGSGKSATLSSILRNVQVTKPGKIITLEEPIETVYPLDGAADIWQREIPENCPTFVRGIVDAMREDPDVILVGEIRDYPTIQAAMQACNTGHLTFATIHANSAPDVVTRVLDLAGDADKSELMSNLARNLKGILSQRLLLKPGNDGRIAVREIIQVGRRQKRQIARNDVDGMTADLRARAADLDSQMLMLAIQGKTTLKSARSASMDRAGFDAMVDALSPRVRSMIIDDVSYEPADDDGDLVKLG